MFYDVTAIFLQQLKGTTVYCVCIREVLLYAIKTKTNKSFTLADEKYGLQQI